MRLETFGTEGVKISASGEYEPGVDSPLKNCPFCGSLDITVENTHTPYYSAMCLGCDAEVPGDYVSDDKNLTTTKSAEREHIEAFNSAIRVWNRRSG